MAYREAGPQIPKVEYSTVETPQVPIFQVAMHKDSTGYSPPYNMVQVPRLYKGPFTDDLRISDGSGGDKTRVRPPGETSIASPALGENLQYVERMR